MSNKMYNELLDKFFKTENFDEINKQIYDFKRNLILEMVNNMTFDENKIDKELFIDEFILPCLI